MKSPKRWRIERTPTFVKQLAEVAKTVEGVEAVVTGWEFWLEHDPRCGIQWGGSRAWYLSSQINVLTVFYSFDDENMIVTLQMIATTLLM